MLSIVILGTGNVAYHLFNAIAQSSSSQIIQVFGRNTKALQQFENRVPVTDSVGSIVAADLYLIAVTDGAIPQLSAQLGSKKGLVAHTSGSVPLTSLESVRKSVFYPLQTFTKGKDVDFEHIPICLEAENEKDYLLLEQLAKSLSNQVVRLGSKQRKALHLAAVFGNNFTNYLYTIVEEICRKNEVDFKLLYPLLSETADKIRFLPPKMAQTGPAKRHDTTTIQEHLNMIDNPTHHYIYKMMSNAIQKANEEEL